MIYISTRESCPKCGSKFVQKTGTTAYFLIGTVLFGLSFWLLFIPAVGYTLMILAVLVLVASLYKKGSFQCDDCGHTWQQK